MYIYTNLSTRPLVDVPFLYTSIGFHQDLWVKGGSFPTHGSCLGPGPLSRSAERCAAQPAGAATPRACVQYSVSIHWDGREAVLHLSDVDCDGRTCVLLPHVA